MRHLPRFFREWNTAANSLLRGTYLSSGLYCFLTLQLVITYVFLRCQYQLKISANSLAGNWP